MIKLNGIEIKSQKFNNGETYIDLPSSILSTVKSFGCYNLFFKFESNQEIWDLMQIVDRIKQSSTNRIKLFMPYCVYSRMDRQENDRLFSLKTFANLINSMGFESVTILEPHSDVAPALIDRIIVKNVSRVMVSNALKDLNVFDDHAQMEFKKICLVWPDCGSDKRYSKQFNYRHTITVGKERDFDTGYLNPKYIFGAENEQDCEIAIIVDDIASSGKTFMMAAEKLRENLPNLKKIILCVAHCENTIQYQKMFDTGLIDAMYTTDSILDTKVINHPKMHVYPCEAYMGGDNSI